MARARRPSRKAQHAKLLRDNRKHYDALLFLQDGVCAICERPPAKRRFDMDHDHRTMRIRGLLCVRCNRALPSWMTPEWLRDAANYLENPTFNEIEKENHL